MENNKENLLAVISSRRRENAKSQLKQILLESYEIYGSGLVEEVEQTCSDIYKEYLQMLEKEDLPDA